MTDSGVALLRSHRGTGAKRSDSESQSRQSGNLDIVRAFAVSTVFFGHLLETTGLRDSPLVGSFARYGVLVFFVHTSLVLMRSIERLELDGRGKVTLRFYIRRFFRIYPLSIACVLVVAALAVPQMPWRSVIRPTPGVVLSNVLLVQDFTGAPSILAPLWSLPFEVQMYLVLPLCYFLVVRARVNAFIVWAAGVLLFAPPLSIVRNLVGYFPCFLAGVIAYALSFNRDRPRVSGKFLFVLLVVSCGIYTGAAGWLQTNGLNWHFHSMVQLLCDWGCSFVIGISLPYCSEVAMPVLRKGAHLLATYSYGVYLTHVPIMWATLLLFPALPAVLRWTLFVSGAFLAPVVVYRTIEHPMMNAGYRIAERFGSPSAAVTRIDQKSFR